MEYLVFSIGNEYKNTSSSRWQWFQIFFGIFTPKLGEDEPTHFDDLFFSNWVGLNHHQLAALSRQGFSLVPSSCFGVPGVDP